MTGGLGGPVRFQARVSSALALEGDRHATRSAQQLAAGAGQGPTVDWTWDASLVTAAGRPLADRGCRRDARRGHAREDGRRAPARSRSPVSPPTPRRSARTATVGGLDHDHLHDDRGRDRHRDAARRGRRPARGRSVPRRRVAGRRAHAHVRRARAARRRLHDRRHGGRRGGRLASRASCTIAITRTLGAAALAPAVFTPNGDGNGDALDGDVPARGCRRRCACACCATASGSRRRSPAPLPAGPAEPRLERRQAGRQAARRLVRGRRRGDRRGRHRDGRRCPFLLDAHPPVVKLAARPPRLWVSEAATVTVRVNGAAASPPGARGPDISRSTGIRTVRTLVVVARDRGGQQGGLPPALTASQAGGSAALGQ